MLHENQNGGKFDSRSPQNTFGITPPLRGSRRSRAFCAKADTVGGMILKYIHPPTGSLAGLRPYLTDWFPKDEKKPVQGGRDFLIPARVAVFDPQ